MMQKYFKIGEISKLYGIGVDSLRYYERIGILKPERAESGYRHYHVQDIWKLNTIRDLRQLGFGMEQIRSYLAHHTLSSTLSLLEQEDAAIEEKIRALKQLQTNVKRRSSILKTAQNRAMNQISLVTLEERSCHSLPEGYSDEYEMDLLIKRLTNMDKEHLYVIGCNQIGTVIGFEDACKTGRMKYQSVFVIDEAGSDRIPAGNYLTLCYRGPYSGTKQWIFELKRYAEDHHLRICGDLLELLWVDIHTTAHPEEYVTELQIRVEKENA